MRSGGGNDNGARQEGTRIAVLVDTATGWGRRLVRGVSNYARGRAAWHLWVEPRGQNEHLRVPVRLGRRRGRRPHLGPADGRRAGGAARAGGERLGHRATAVPLPACDDQLRRQRPPRRRALPRAGVPLVRLRRPAAARIRAAARAGVRAGRARHGRRPCAAFDYRDDLAGHGRAWAERERDLGEWMRAAAQAGRDVRLGDGGGGAGAGAVPGPRDRRRRTTWRCSPATTTRCCATRPARR